MLELKTNASFLFLALILMVSQATARQANPPELSLSAKDFSGRTAIGLGDVMWRYHSGDNSEWAKPDFDDSAWERVYPALYRTLPENGWQGVGWFRLAIALDSSLAGQPLGLTVRQAGVSEFYLDGKKLYEFGAGTGSKRKGLGDVRALTLQGSGRHLLAVRYRNDAVAKLHAAAWPAGFVFSIGRINDVAAEVTGYLKTLTGYQMFLTALPLAVGLLHLILFSFFPSSRQNLYFALFLFFYAAAVFFDYQSALTADFSEQLDFLRIHRAVFPLMVLFQLRFVYSLFQDGVPRRFWLMAAITLAFGLFAVQKPDDYFKYLIFGVAFVFAEIGWVILMAVARRREGARVIGAAFLVTFGFIIFDALIDLGLDVPFRDMQNPYAFGSIGFAIAMSIYLSRDIARTNQKMLAQEVERKVLEADNARKTQELEEARDLQLSMLPEYVEEIPGHDICFHMQTATEVGGDYYDYRVGADGALTIAIGDATGHGMKAGTMVSVVKSMFIANGQQANIPAFFRQCSGVLKQMKLGNLYMSMLVIKIRENRMLACAAGMPPIFIYRVAGQAVEEMTIKGMPLGAASDFPYQTHETTLNPGDAVLLMSDGLPELFNEEGEEFDYPRARQTFAGAATKSAQEIIDALIAAGETWRGRQPQADDITFVVIKKM